MSARSLTTVDGDRTLITCPLCRQAARVDRHGDHLAVRCFGGCQEASVREALDVDRVLAELLLPLSANGNGPGRATTAPAARRRVVLTPASAISPEMVRWLWDRRLPLRGLSLIAGEPGLGKSTLTAELAAEVTRGRLPGDLHGQPADVLIATAEDHFASVVWGRLMAAGADMDRVHRVHVEDRGEEELLTLPDDVAEIEARCEELRARSRPVALLAVDPVTAFIGGGVDTHRDAAVRRVLAPLAGLAERQQLAVVGVAHLNKDTAGKLLARVGGSVAFGAAPRSVLAFARHPDDPDGEQGVERVIVHAKSNHGRYAPSLAARIESREVIEVGEVSRLVIDGECEIGPDDLGAQTGGDHHDLDAAVEWLADELADGQWHESREVKARAKAAGHSERTLKRAKQTLGIEDRREGFPAVSEWRLTVGPPPGGASGPTDGGPTVRTRIPEPKATDPPPSWATTRGLGPTGGERPATDAGEAEDAWGRYLPQASQASQASQPRPRAERDVTDVTDVTDSQGSTNGRVAELPLGTAAELAELERVQDKFESLGGGAS